MLGLRDSLESKHLMLPSRARVDHDVAQENCAQERISVLRTCRSLLQRMGMCEEIRSFKQRAEPLCFWDLGLDRLSQHSIPKSLAFWREETCRHILQFQNLEHNTPLSERAVARYTP